MILFNILLILFIHYFADFICQTRWMAENKSKNVTALTSHVLVYSLVMFLALFGIFEIQSVCIFIGINAILHWMTDFLTSKATSYFWSKKETFKFFATIGLDQYIHQVCLISTAYFLFR